jgi:hypothetical protein
MLIRFPQQQWMERASVLRCTYFACVVKSEVMDACYMLTVLCVFCVCFAPYNL